MSVKTDIAAFSRMMPSPGVKSSGRGVDKKPRVRWRPHEIEAIAKRVHFHYKPASWHGIPLLHAVRESLVTDELKEQNVRFRDIHSVAEVERVRKALSKLAVEPVPQEEQVIIEHPKTLKEIVQDHFKTLVLDDKLDFLAFMAHVQQEVLLEVRIEAEAVDRARELLQSQEPPKVDVSVVVKMPTLPPSHKAKKVIRLFMHREKDKHLFEFLQRTYGKLVDFDHLFKNEQYRDHKHIRFDNRIDAIWIESSGVPSAAALAVHKAANQANIPVEIFKSSGQLKSTAAFKWADELHH